MKHLLITPDFPPQFGGIATYLKNLSDQFNPQDLLVLAPPRGESNSFDGAQRYPIQRNLKLTNWKKFILDIRRIVKGNQIDHVIISHVIPMGYVALASGTPYTVIIHGMDIRLAGQKWHRKMLTKCVLKKAAIIVVNSNDTKQALAAFGNFESKTVLAYPCPKPLDQIAINPAREQEIKSMYFDGHEVILSVNRLVKRKGNDMVIKSLPALRTKHPTLRYVILGNGVEKDYLLTVAKEQGVQDMVTIVENIGDQDLQYFFRNAKLFVQPARMIGESDVEGFGIVYLEAALFGLPSVAGNVGGAPESVINGQTGITVDPDSTQAIAEAVERLLSDDALRVQLGEAAKTRAQSDFTWPKQFKELLNRIS